MRVILCRTIRCSSLRLRSRIGQRATSTFRALSFGLGARSVSTGHAPAPIPETPPEAELPVVIESSSLQECGEDVTIASGTEFLCSWNVVNAPTPTIVVPGEARQFTALKTPVNLLKYIRPPSLAHENLAALDPALHSLYVTKPGVKLNHVDVIAPSTCLAMLLGFVRNAASRTSATHDRTGFSALELSVVRNTLIIQPRCKEKEGMAQVLGKADSSSARWWSAPVKQRFQQAFTSSSPGCDDYDGHRQLLQYKVGSLTCAVVRNVDAAYYDEARSSSITNARLNRMRTLAGRYLRKQRRPSLDIKVGGRGTPLSAAVQVQTTKISGRKSAKRGPRVWLPLRGPRVWFDRMAYSILGSVDVGSVDVGSVEPPPTPKAVEFEVSELEEHILSFEQQNQSALRKCVSLLEKLREIVSRADEPCVAEFKSDPAASMSLHVYRFPLIPRLVSKRLEKRFWPVELSASHIVWELLDERDELKARKAAWKKLMRNE